MLYFGVQRSRLNDLKIWLPLCLAGSLLFCMPVKSETLSDRGWQEFPRLVPVLKDGFVGNVEREVEKTDYFIFQKQVVIDEPILTNGGNVLIVTDELVLNAPIDTRVYMKVKPDYWVAAPPGQDGIDFSSLGLALGAAPEGLLAFDSLYLWRETYDPKKKMFVYSVAERPTSATKPGSQTLGTKVVELPQLPSGQVPLASWKEYERRYDSTKPTDGTDAPDGWVVWPAVKSGAIGIYANRISLCDRCTNNLSGFRTLEEIITIPSTKADPFDQEERAVFLQVSGLKGGRGAAGSMYASEVGNLVGMLGGLSGKPGRGGDAGSIEVHYVNHSPTEDERSLLKLAALAERGAPAQSHRQRTPSLAGIRAHPTRTAFRDEVPVPDLEQLFGSEGKILIDSVDTDEAIRAIHEKLAEAELGANYSAKLLIGKPGLFSISPNSTLEIFLAQELVRLQSEFIGLLERKLTSSATSRLEYSPFFASLTCNPRAYPMLPDRQQEYLAKLCDFRAVAKSDPVSSYLFRVGGVYQDVPDINVSIRHQQIVVELNRTQQLIRDAIDEIKDIHSLVFESISGQQRKQLENAVRKLQLTKQALQDAYEAASKDQPGLAEYALAIAKAGQDFGEGLVAFYDENYLLAAVKFESGMENFAEGLGPLLVAYKFPPSSLNFAQLDAAIKAVERDLKDFVALVQETKSNMMKSRGDNLRGLMLARYNLEEYRTSTRFDFASMIRAVLQEYFQTSDVTTLRKNLEVVRSTINEANNSLTLYLPSVRRLCLGNPTSIPFAQLTDKAGCVEFDRRSSYVILSKRPNSDLPLLVVSKADGSITRSLEQAFQASEIQKLPITENGW